MHVTIRFDPEKEAAQIDRMLRELERPVAGLKLWAAAGAKRARENARKMGYHEIPRSIRVGAIDADRLQTEVIADTVYAGIRNYGGVISAPGKGPYSRGSRLLTIPISKAAKGKTARELGAELGGLFLVKTARQLLLATCKPGRKGAKGALDFHYVLKKSVKQRGSYYWPFDSEWLRLGEIELTRLLRQQEAKINERIK